MHVDLRHRVTSRASNVDSLHWPHSRAVCLWSESKIISTCRANFSGHQRVFREVNAKNLSASASCEAREIKSRISLSAITFWIDDLRDVARFVLKVIRSNFLRAEKQFLLDFWRALTSCLKLKSMLCACIIRSLKIIMGFTGCVHYLCLFCTMQVGCAKAVARLCARAI